MGGDVPAPMGFESNSSKMSSIAYPVSSLIIFFILAKDDTGHLSCKGINVVYSNFVVSPASNSGPR